MNILIVSRAEWADTNAFGNTYSNFFSDRNIWQNATFYHIYMRNSTPDNDVCRYYYNMPFSSIVKNSFTRKNIGYEFEYKDRKKYFSENNSENEKINLLHKKHNNFIYSCMEHFLNLKTWKNDNLICFLKKVNPDIIFVSAISNGFYENLVRIAKQYTKAKIVLYVADDVYGKYNRLPFYRGKMLKKGFEYLISTADKLYGASDLLCKEYAGIFNKQFTPLYKGCSFKEIQYGRHTPYKIVYAGNLLYGRDLILAKLVQALEIINRKEPTFILEIYSGTIPTENQLKAFNVDGTSFFFGKKPYSEIVEIQNHSDFVLHVESFEKEQIDYVRYSFSTKIIDCLQSGAVTLAIGPKGIASIEYIRKIPGTFVIDDLDEIEKILKRIIMCHLDDEKEKTRIFASKYHKAILVNQTLKDDFLNLLN